LYGIALSTLIPPYFHVLPTLRELQGVQELHWMVDMLEGKPVGRNLGAVVEPQTPQQFTAPPL
jgi:hypothetical protein